MPYEPVNVVNWNKNKNHTQTDIHFTLILITSTRQPTNRC